MRGAALAVSLALAGALAVAHPAQARSAPDTIIVFDGSGSMWGQIDGRHKIEIARDTLSSVLSESVSDMRIGMIAYGHRQKGQCSDIETVVPIGPAQSTVPAMLNAANALNPKGKTPLTDAVRRAADELRYTESAATVILVTDGIETCDADPCALGRELEAAGIDFTAHVVGFGLSAEEGRQVQCLADNTGGLYIRASDAGELTTALQRTIEPAPIAPDPSDFEEVVEKREVRFLLRDTDEGDLLNQGDLAVLIETAEGEPVEARFGFDQFNIGGSTGAATLEPGAYRMLIRRDANGSGGYRTTLDFTVPPGDGVHTVEASLSGALVVNPFLNPSTPYEPASRFDPAVGGQPTAKNGWAWFYVFPVEDGERAAEPVVSKVRGDGELRFPLPAGEYAIVGAIDGTVAAEQMVEVAAGAPTEVDFSFDATRVFVDARDADGFPVRRQTTYFYDKMRDGRNYFASGRGAGSGGVQPFLLPVGTWLVNAGDEGGGARRSERVVDVPGDFQDIRLRFGEGETLPEGAAGRITPCAEFVALPNAKGCLPERGTSGIAGAGDDAPLLAPNDNPFAGIEPAPAPDGNRRNEAAQADTGPDMVAAPSGPVSLDGLSGTAHAFADPSGAIRLHVVIDDASEAATVVLADGWCGAPDCPGLRQDVHRDELRLVEASEGGVGTVEVAGHRLEIANFGTNVQVFVTGPNGRRAGLALHDRIVLAAAPAPAAPAVPTIPSDLSGRGFAFGEEGGGSMLLVVPDEGDATIVLSDGCAAPTARRRGWPCPATGSAR